MKKLRVLIIVVLLISLIGCTDNQSSEPLDIVIDASSKGYVSPEEVNEVEETESIYKFLDQSKIDSQNALSIIEMLSSDKYLGRQSGTDENNMAVDELVKLFEEYGLQPLDKLDGYKQYFEQQVVLPEKSTFVQLEGEEPYVYQQDFTERFRIGKSDYEGDVTAEMIYITKASDMEEDHARFDHKILLLSRSLYYDDRVWMEISRMQREDIYIDAVVTSSEGSDAGMRVSRGLRNNGFETFDENDPVIISFKEDIFLELIKASKTGKKLTISMDFEEATKTPANVVGMIPGKNEDGENEVVILGAHLDHVGNNLDGTYNPGALDNASGISVLLEIARVLQYEEQPENTILFVAFNGEEDGLLGSKYFVDNPPIHYEAHETVMLNFDMVGSTLKVPLYMDYVGAGGKRIGESYLDIVEELSIQHAMGEGGGSDHVNFAHKGIPALMFIHFDPSYYHTSGDTVEQALDEDRLHDVLKLALALVDREAYQDLD